MTKRVWKKLLAVSLAVSLGLLLQAVPFQGDVNSSRGLNVTAYAATLSSRNTDVSAASQGNTLLSIRGHYYAVSKEKALARINEIRYEACKEGLINPSTGEKLTLDDYNPIKWSSDLEWIAQTRAAEASVLNGHSRPNGTSCFTCLHNGEQSWAENLAWNWSGWNEGIEQWYEEKEDWVKQNYEEVTGHYESLINPAYNYVGLGCFRLLTGGWYAVSGEFSFMTGLDEAEIGVSGIYDQMIEVPTSQKSDYEAYSNTKITISDASIASIKNQVYTASAIKPSLTIKYEGEKLVKGTDYTLTYKNNKNIGTATVIIKGKGLYSGTIKKTFKIVPKPTTVSKVVGSKKAFTVKWKKQTKQTTGYQIQYSTSKSFKSGNKTITIKGTKGSSKKITQCKAKKTYYVRVRTYKSASGKKYYSSWSKAQKVIVK